ncbi:MAG: ARMT1-like domain-containing protein [Prolixibacteraceae bacterium]|nr:ARMT1-like domain-containing protein [Prolixibacteraceae bacterium]
MREECYKCHLKTVEKLIEKFAVPRQIADGIWDEVKSFLVQNREMTNPLLATHIQRIARRHLKMDDLYIQEKQATNALLLKTYEWWKDLISKSPSPVQTAAKLAVIGNIIDYGAHSVPEELESFIEEKLHHPFHIDESENLENDIKKAKNVLYLGDNAGEIVFDKLLIETLKHPGITFVVRGRPVLNDITLADAEQVGIDKLCKVITNGYDAPSTLVPYCSDEFKQAWDSADLVISKGQGNFEGLMDEKKNIYFLLMAKCNPIAELIGTEKGAMIIKKVFG